MNLHHSMVVIQTLSRVYELSWNWSPFMTGRAIRESNIAEGGPSRLWYDVLTHKRPHDDIGRVSDRRLSCSRRCSRPKLEGRG